LSEQRLIFAPDGKVLAFSYEGTLVLWDLASSTERLHLEGHREPVVFLSFSPEGALLKSSTR
jgi:WD40 repeat protein